MRGSTFLHPPLRFRIDFPAEVGDRQQSAAGGGEGARRGRASCCCSGVQQAAGSRRARRRAEPTCRAAGFRAVHGERTTINGLDAFVGSYQGQIEGLGEVASRAAHIAHGDVYLHDGRARRPGALRRGRWRVHDRDPLVSVRCPRRKPRPSGRIAWTSTPSATGDTWASIAERSGGAITAATLAAMNQTAPTPRRVSARGSRSWWQDEGSAADDGSAPIRERRCAGVGAVRSA